MRRKQNRTARDLILSLIKERAMTQRELAEMLGRSPDFVSLVKRGKRPGENLRAALLEIEQTGTLTTPPPRRRRKDGKLARVRAPRTTTVEPGQDVPRPSVGDGLRIPIERDGEPGDEGLPPGEGEDPKDGQGPDKGRPGVFVDPPDPSYFGTSASVLPGGARIHTIGVPKSPNTPGFDKAKDQIRRTIRSVTKGQRWQTKRVRVAVTLDNGQVLSIGQKHGYKASDLLKQINSAFAGDSFKWAKHALQNVTYSGLDLSKRRIISMDITSFYHQDVQTFAGNQYLGEVPGYWAHKTNRPPKRP